MQRWWAMTLVAALAGCGVNRQAGRQDVDETVQARIGRPAFHSAASTDPRIEALLQHDLTPEVALDIALHQNPALMAAYGRFGVSQSDLTQAGLVKNPTLGIGFRFPQQAQNQVGWQVSFAVDFLDSLLLPLRQRVAAAEFERAKAELAQDIVTTTVDVQKAFIGVQAAQQLVAVRRLLLDAAQSATTLAERQRAVGNISDLDLSFRQSQYQEAKLDLVRDELQVVSQREQLNRLLGLWGPQTAWTIATPLPELPAEELSLDHWESFAIANRLDIAAARHEVAGLTEALQLAYAARVGSSVEVGATTEHSVEGYSGTGPDLRIELPLFDRRQASIGRLESQLEVSRSRLNKLAIDVRSEVRAARLALLTQRQVVNHYRMVLIPLKERITAESQRYYNAMLLGTYPLLQAKQAEVNTYRDYIAAVRDYWLTHAELVRVLGSSAPTNVRPNATTGGG